MIAPAASAPCRAVPRGINPIARPPAWPMGMGFTLLRVHHSGFGELPIVARLLWVIIFAAAWRPHYAGRLPFCDAREVALATGVTLPVVRGHLDDLLACGALRVADGGLVAEVPAWRS